MSRKLVDVSYTDLHGSRTLHMALDDARCFARECTDRRPDPASGRDLGPLLHEVLIHDPGSDHAELWAQGECMLSGSYASVMKGLAG